jgi:Uma2 family endonuclease
MRAQPIEGHAYTRWHPDPARQKAADYTVEDVLNLPPDAPRVELSDGVLLVVPSPTESHQDICSRLWSWLDSHAPEQYWPVQAVGVAVAVDHTLEPDLLLRRAGGDGNRHFFTANQAVLVVEVVSPGTRARDRFAKPTEYAAAGIPFYWRIEQNPIHVYAYRLAPNGRYELAADSSELLELDEPFPIKLAVADLAARRRPASATE